MELQKQHIYSGRFSPFSYSIGLETSSVEAALALIQEYPLRNPESSKQRNEFLQSLAFFHETAHLAQYVSTSYGLRSLRLTNISLNYIFKKNDWKLPVLENFLNSEVNRSEFEVQAGDRFCAFTDAADQMRIYYTTVSNSNKKDELLEWKPWSPHFVPLFKSGMDPYELAKIIENVGGYVRRIPIITLNNEESASKQNKIIINVAALMEAYAILVEINHIYNAYNMKINFIEAMDFIPTSTEYFQIILYSLFDKSARIEDVLLTLTACIDIALMYDPFTLYNSKILDKPEIGEIPDLYPGETFISACNAAKKIEPIRKYTQAPEFYEGLCKEMGLPTPSWISGKALEVASNQMKQFQSGDRNKLLLSKAMTLHYEGLKLRNLNPSRFPFELATTDILMKFLEISKSCVTFYNLNTFEPISPYEDRTDVLQIHNLLNQFLLDKKIECPLKKGHPFFCPSYDKHEDTLCAWRDFESVKHECRADIFDSHINYSNN